MMRRGSWLAAALLVACATAASPEPPSSETTFTRASLEPRSTAELATLFLQPDDAATIERARIRDPFFPGGPLWGIHFFARPRPLVGDVCGREVFHVGFGTVEPTTDETSGQDLPARSTGVSHYTQVALAPDCAALPGRRFANVGFRSGPPGEGLTLDDGMGILQRLAAARTAAAWPGPLPFRLRCNMDESRVRRDCPADLRAELARLPIHQAIGVDRPPFQQGTLCGPSVPGEGDSVEVEMDRDRLHLWEVRLIDMNTSDAEIVLSWTPRRDSQRC